ncbi:MAG: hypothetical protein IBX72_06990 [Nitrospirae bacterium]|nr:hypothetical protein [Nitrospirota bacterium]
MTRAQVGDVLLLFSHLPYEYDKDLPIKITPGLYLDEIHREILAKAPLSLSCFVLPGYETGMGFTHCCLHSPISEEPYLRIKRNNLFFYFITALRLRAPIGIHISGQFELSADSELIRNPSLFNLRTPWQPNEKARYSFNDINLSKDILTALINCSNDRFKNLRNAIVLFSQVTCGFSISYQMCYLTLFVILESLFSPKGNKAEMLSSRVASFLSRFDHDGSIKNWLKKEYETGRNNLAHGIWDISPDEKSFNGKNTRFGRLHEITRLCLLEFVSMDNDRLIALSQSGKKLQNELDRLQPANGTFVEGQSMWLA